MSKARDCFFLTWRGCFWGAPGLVLPGRLSSVWWGRSRRLTSVPAPAASSGAGEPAADSLLLRWTCQRRNGEDVVGSSPILPGCLTSFAAGPRRHWADRRCRRSAGVASTPAAPRWSGPPVRSGWCLGDLSAGAPRPSRQERRADQRQRPQDKLLNGRLNSTRPQKLNTVRNLWRCTLRDFSIYFIFNNSPVVWLSAPNTSC